MLLSKLARRPNKQPSKWSSPLQHSSSHEGAVLYLTVNTNFITLHINFNLPCIGDPESKKACEDNTHVMSIMDVDTLSSQSSVIDMTVNSLNDEEATEEKIIKDAENKICESSESVKAKTYLVYSQKSQEKDMAIHCIRLLCRTTKSCPEK